ncbi:GLPGLI family protein [Elizabethkingia anophelis]|uniref:GLPGLI family protein n=1 Tax=Elizabethkingia anophelis TaxID=1117645 RepID=UPI000C9CE05D|nr:GLPGLI family protein [Elizabethkingia anophelis]MCT3758181.1 GLPGLI family protein [Elizabethkingia anophelis]MCT3973558.1 GLPGLI family protein [Elizabethkingia anophelis]MCT4001680.1 GLPGLI family protein [Elizabethkingia anophelis]MCT4015751.1 GLPGLI family protein [Elizabethkingia anophelis]MCT4019261.1 GLPGLI family protein [Elizabethkingia anophelis]
MKIKLFSLLIFVVNICSAQSFRFEYELSIIYDTLSSNPQKFNTALEITPIAKKFYDMDVYKYDSIQSKKGRSGYMNTGFDQNLVKLKSDQINHTFHNISNDDWFQLESKDEIKWKITEERKNNKGYKLQKATGDFGGREWTAWFTQDIPIPEGPYKFGGLPGLIIEINDSKTHYRYELTKVTKLINASNTFNILEKQRGKKAIDITLPTYQKLLMEHYNDPYKYLLNSASFNFYDQFSGRTYTKPEELRDARIDEQKRIKKYYNPIELDKAVKYPN